VLKRNLIANYLGQGWAALMGLAFIPVYIKYLGIESYGLIGLFAVLTTCLSLFDMGMTPTLSREMARFTGGSHDAESIRDLLRSIEVLTVSIALLIAAGVALGAPWIATNWLSGEKLPIHIVIQSITIMGTVSALRFVETIYHGSINGLQRQVLFNIANSSIATLRGLGAVAILVWVSPTIQAFFLWQGLLSIFTLAILASITYSSLPSIKRRARFSPTALRSVMRFAGGMFGISFLALLLTQVDKVLLSKLLTLGEYGYYALAATVAGVLYMLISPITLAVYPRLCELQGSDDQLALAKSFHKAAQMVSVFAGSVAIVLMLFSETFLRLWTQDSILAVRTAPLLSLLVLGNLLNGLMWVPYQTQLAFGWTSLTVKVNVVAVALIIPTIVLVTPHYGSVGAAWAWACLNLGYVLIAALFMYRRILKTEKLRWYLEDLLAPLGAGSLIALFLKLFWQNANSQLLQFLQVLLAYLLVCVTSLLAASQLNGEFLSFIQNRWKCIRGACLG